MTCQVMAKGGEAELPWCCPFELY